MVGCCVLPLCCGGSGACYTLGSCSGGVDGSCGTAMLNMSVNCFSDDVCFSPRCRMVLVVEGFWSASMSYTTVCVTTSAGDRIGIFLCTDKSSIDSEARSDDVLGMYNVRHR